MKNDPSMNTSRQTIECKTDISYYTKMDQPSVISEGKKKDIQEEKDKKKGPKDKFSQEKKIVGNKKKNFLSPRY